MNIKEIIYLYLKICTQERKLSPHSIRAYQADFEHFLSCVGSSTNVFQIDKDLIKRYVSQLTGSDFSVATIKRKLASIKAFFRWMEVEEKIHINPFNKLALKLKSPKTLPKNIPRRELTTLARSAATCLYELLKTEQRSSTAINQVTVALATELMLTTGIRVGELVSIKLEQIYWQEKRIKIFGKGQRERYVYVSDDELMAFLVSYLSKRANYFPKHDYLLINSRGGVASTQFIRKYLHQFAKSNAVHMRITPHMYRHSSACQLLEAGLDIRFVQRLLGHHSIATTQIYTHVNDAVLQQKIETANIRKDLLIK